MKVPNGIQEPLHFKTPNPKFLFLFIKQRVAVSLCHLHFEHVFMGDSDVEACGLGRNAQIRQDSAD